MANEPSILMLTPTGRMSYPNLVEPRAYKEKSVAKGDPFYTCEFIFDPEDIKKFRMLDESEKSLVEVDAKQQALKLALEAWSGDFKDVDEVKQAIKFKGIAWPFHKGEKIAEARGGKDEEALAGKTVIRTKSSAKFRPTLRYVDKEGKMRDLQPGITEHDRLIADYFVGGYYAKAEVNLKAGKTAQGPYLTFYLNSVCFIKPGERFGRGSALMDLAGVEGGEADYDPTEGMESEIDTEVDL